MSILANPFTGFLVRIEVAIILIQLIREVRLIAILEPNCSDEVLALWRVFFQLNTNLSPLYSLTLQLHPKPSAKFKK